MLDLFENKFFSYLTYDLNIKCCIVIEVLTCQTFTFILWIFSLKSGLSTKPHWNIRLLYSFLCMSSCLHFWKVFSKNSAIGIALFSVRASSNCKALFKNLLFDHRFYRCSALWALLCFRYVHEDFVVFSEKILLCVSRHECSFVFSTCRIPDSDSGVLWAQLTCSAQHVQSQSRKSVRTHHCGLTVQKRDAFCTQNVSRCVPQTTREVKWC